MPHPNLTPLLAETLFPNLTMDNEYLDQQLAAITGCWVDGDLAGIAEKGKALVTQEIYDLRLLTYYLYSLWAGDDNCELGEVLAALHNLLRQPVEVWGSSIEDSPPSPALPPQGGKGEDNTSLAALQSLLKTCLGMLLRRIEQRLGRVKISSNGAGACAVVGCCEQLTELLSERYTLPDFNLTLAEIAGFYQEECRDSQPAPEVEALPDEVSDSEQPDKHPQPSVEVEPEAPAHSPQQVASDQPLNTEAEITYSYPMQRLLDNIRIFETLVQQEELYKAAVVFELIQQELTNFNPLHYLPELFSRYAAARALFAPQLHQLVQQRNPVQWQALQDYLLVDPKGFMGLPVTLADVSKTTPDLGRDPSDDGSKSDLSAYQRQRPIDRSRRFNDDD